MPNPDSIQSELSLHGFRVGSVPYLNAAPLTYGVEDQIRFLPPSQLAKELHSGHLDAALVSITEVIFHSGYHALDEFAILSRGPVYSVVLSHQDPFNAISQVHLDPASCTSVQLLRGLMALKGQTPAWAKLHSYEEAVHKKNVLLIGNPAIDFRRSHPERPIWDLGAAWAEMIGDPFVYAVWAIRTDRAQSELPSKLAAIARRGWRALETIRSTRIEYDEPFRRAYLGGYIQYDLDDAAKRGAARFGELVAQSDELGISPIQWVKG